MPDQDEGYTIISETEQTAEPTAVETPDPVDAPATDAPPEPKAEGGEQPPEETPEELEAKKKLTGSARAKAKAERLAENLRQANERIAALERGGQPEKPKAPAQDDSEPTQDQFETHAEWVKALGEYTYKKARAEERAQEQAAKVVQSWEEKKEAARKELEDFDEVLADMEAPAPVAVAVMAESEHSAKIAYYLGQHPDELRKINQMAPPAAALAVARIEAGFTKADPPPPKPTTKAPAPMRPTQGGSAAPQEDAGYVIY